jgi:hypothetical protein
MLPFQKKSYSFSDNAPLPHTNQLKVMTFVNIAVENIVFIATFY